MNWFLLIRNYNCWKLFILITKTTTLFAKKRYQVWPSLAWEFPFSVSMHFIAFLLLHNSYKQIKTENIFEKFFCLQGFLFIFIYFDFILICFEISMIDFNCFVTCKKKIKKREEKKRENGFFYSLPGFWFWFCGIEFGEMKLNAV